MVQFARQKHKSEVFRNVRKLKDLLRWKADTLTDDLAPEALIKRGDMRWVYALAKQERVQAYLRGNDLIIDGKKFSHGELCYLPHNLSLERAKTIVLENGIAFEGQHSYMSNFYTSPFKYQGTDFCTAEQYFQYLTALAHTNNQIASKILLTADPHQVKALGTQIRESSDWAQRNLKTLEDVTYQKFVQNPVLRTKLLDTCDVLLYEATADRAFGCGFRLHQYQEITVNCPGNLGKFYNESVTNYVNNPSSTKE